MCTQKLSTWSRQKQIKNLWLTSYPKLKSESWLLCCSRVKESIHNDEKSQREKACEILLSQSLKINWLSSPPRVDFKPKCSEREISKGGRELSTVKAVRSSRFTCLPETNKKYTKQWFSRHRTSGSGGQGSLRGEHYYCPNLLPEENVQATNKEGKPGKAWWSVSVNK